MNNVTDKSFDGEVLRSELPVLVDFWAEWCAPCKMMSPILDSLAEECSGKLKICKVDIDDNQAIAARYRIRSLPTFMIFKGGQIDATTSGAMTQSQLAVWLESHL